MTLTVREEGAVIQLNFNPSLWGENGWIFLRALPYLFSNFRGKLARSLILNLARILPCIICERKFVDYLKNHPLPLDVSLDANQLIIWIEAARKDVDDRLGKQYIFRSYKDFPIKSWLRATLSFLYFAIASKVRTSALYDFLISVQQVLFQNRHQISSTQQKQLLSIFSKQIDLLIKEFVKQFVQYKSCRNLSLSSSSSSSYQKPNRLECNKGHVSDLVALDRILHQTETLLFSINVLPLSSRLTAIRILKPKV